VNTRANLRDAILLQIKDGSLSTLADLWIDAGASQLGEVLRCAEMETTITRNTGDPDVFITIPSDSVKLLEYSAEMSGTWIPLQSIGKNARMPISDGRPVSYYIHQGKLYPVPSEDRNYRLTYLAAPAIPEDDAAESVFLQRYRPLFYFAALVEAYDYKEDAEMSQVFERKRNGLAAAITRRWESERIGDLPAMRSV